MRSSVYFAVKRLVDIIVAGLALVLSSPVLLIIGLVVVLTLGRPVLFRQGRPGLHGVPFRLAKFRTMRQGPGSDGQRLTAVGRFLRSTSLDELPELWNVIRGDMSLVGPRPLLMEYLSLYNDRQARRHEVRPGLTGLAQVNGRNAVAWDDRLELDAVYVEQVSPGLDLRILGRTVSSVLRREGIAAEGQATMERFTGSAPARPASGSLVVSR